MARPALPNSQRRVINFTIRLTKEELDTLNSRAELCGKTASELVREKIFTGHFPRPKAARIDVQTFLELKKIGVNINQQTKLLNSGRLPYGLRNVLNELKQNEERIIRELMYDRQPENR